MEDFLALGYLASTAREYALAEKAFKHVAAIAPQKWEPHCGLAQIYDSAGRDQEALSEFHLAIELNQNSYEPHNGLAMFYVKQGDIEPAIEQLERACKLAPTEPIPHFNLGLVLAKTGKLSEAYRAILMASDMAQPGELLDKISQVLAALEQELDSKP